jgi:flagellar FliJ protein
MMAKKQFRLEQVLNVRKETEKKRMLEFATARDEFEGASERLKQEEHHLECLDSECLQKQEQGISAVELQLYSEFFCKKSLEIKQHRGEVDHLGRRMVEKREDLLEASKEKKVLESLKEKDAKVREKEAAVKEQAFLDEIALRPRRPKP